MAELFIVTRELGEQATRLLEKAPEIPALLLGRGLLSNRDRLGSRELIALEEEVRELGLDGVLNAGLSKRSATDVVELICASHLMNLE